MKVLVAGAAGALGRPTVRLLNRNGHEVYGLTRSEANADALRGEGVRPVFADVLDPDAVERAVAKAAPDGVVQLLNALPKRGPIRPAELRATNKLRIEGTENLLAAAIRHGVTRYATESMIFGYGYGDRSGERLSEDAPFGEPVGLEGLDEALDALGHMEKLVLGASERGDIQGVVLRLGLFYGPGVGSTDFMIKLLRRRLMYLPGGGQGVLSWIHVEDGAAAVVAALESAPAGSVFNVVDDRPASMNDLARELADALGLPGPKSVPVALARLVSSYAAAMANTNLRASNARIKDVVGWKPAYPDITTGVRRTIASPSGGKRAATA